jgi:hypothetical protein
MNSTSRMPPLPSLTLSPSSRRRTSATISCFMLRRLSMAL